MTNEFKDMLYLLKCSARNEEPFLRADMDYKKIGTLAMQQQIMPLIFPFIEKAYNEGLFKTEADTIKNMKNRIFASVALGMQKQEFLSGILKKMEQQGIKCILLKGALLADLYPAPDLRLSGDIDLYIDEKDEKAAIKILESFGFDIEKRLPSEHHSECRHKLITSLELHVSLYEDYCTDLWFDNITYNVENTIKYTTKSGHTYNALETNEQLIFNILHLIKHFLSSGVGIRQLLDILLFMERNIQSIDKQKYIQTMKSLKFDYFMDCCMEIGISHLGSSRENLIWINHENIPETSCEKILNDIEASGLFGHNDTERRSFNTAYTNALYKTKFNDKGEEYKKNRRRKNMLSIIFLDYDHMKLKYKYLNYGKWLLPLAWIHRGFNFILAKKNTTNAKPLTNQQEKHLELMRDMKII